MKRKILLGLLILALIAVPLFAAACEEEEKPPPAQQEEEEEEEEEGEWWDKFGEPQYGGTITYGAGAKYLEYIWQLDVDNFIGGEMDLWYDALIVPDWKLDREIWDMTGMYVPDQYNAGCLAESWELPDAQTIIVHLQHGVYWQNKPPVNGRELTAYDVQEHYDRILGVGKYTANGPFPMYGGMVSNFESVTATDDHTVVFKFKEPSAQNFQSISTPMTLHFIEAPEWVALPDDERADWHNVVGSGPWMLEDMVIGSSIIFAKNPDYWGTDPRYPENQVPYVDTLKIMVIQDDSSRIAAMRTGLIDVMTDVSRMDAQNLAKSNPELEQKSYSGGDTEIVLGEMNPPFTDIRVRKALNMAVDREAIAASIYGGSATTVMCGLISQTFKGIAFDYEDWPQELKDGHTYNPERARQLLAEAAADGVFEVNEYGGFDTNIITASSGTGDIEVLEAFKSMFMDIGVDMEINVVEWSQYNSIGRAGEYDQLLSRHGGLTWPPTRAVGQDLGGTSDALEVGIVSNAGYDALFGQFWAAKTSAEADQIIREIDRYILEQYWAVSTGEYFLYNIWQPRVKGYSGEIIFWGNQFTWAKLWVAD